jgi:Flp pilus assembly protein TadG
MRKTFGRVTGALARLGAAQEGASAVEFALIAPAFIAVLVAIFQVAVFLFAQQSLQNGAVEAGRQLMTGQAQNDTQSQFKSRICPAYLPSILFNCSRLTVVVQSYTSFSAASTACSSQASYNPGTPGEIVVVQLVYPWSVVTGPLGFALSHLPNGAATMCGVTAFRVEPY